MRSYRIISANETIGFILISGARSDLQPPPGERPPSRNEKQGKTKSGSEKTGCGEIAREKFPSRSKKIGRAHISQIAKNRPGENRRRVKNDPSKKSVATNRAASKNRHAKKSRSQKSPKHRALKNQGRPKKTVRRKIFGG